MQSPTIDSRSSKDPVVESGVTNLGANFEVSSPQRINANDHHQPNLAPTGGSRAARRPIIAIDGVVFQLQRNRPAGISRVWSGLLTELAKTPLAGNILLLDRGDSAPHFAGIRRVSILEYPPGSPEADSIYLQHVMTTERADLCISTYYTIPENSPAMIVLHDMTPEVMAFNLEHPEWRAKTRAIHKCSAYLSVSEATLRDFRSIYPQYRHRPVHLVPNTVGPDFRIHNDAEIQRFRHRQNLVRPYFLVCGHRSGYKNALLFFRAFSLLPNKADFDIVCTGGEPELERSIHALIKGSRCELRFFSDNELSLAYSGAVALVYPSLYEGFGLPILEAMNCGCPTIAVRASSIPEVGGEAVHYVDGHDVDKMIAALNAVQNYARRIELVNGGLQNAQRFSWERSRFALVDALEQVLRQLPFFERNSDDPLTTGHQLVYRIATRPGLKDLRTALADSFMQASDDSTCDPFEPSTGEKRIQALANDSLFTTLTDACRQEEADAYLHYWLGLLRQARGQSDEALASYQKSIRIGLVAPRILWRAARLAEELNKLITASRLAATLARLKPGNPKLLALQERLDRKHALVKEAFRLQLLPSTAKLLTLPVAADLPENLLVSIILPTKGRSEGLEAVLASLPQAFGQIRYEVLVYFGGGSDEAIADLTQHHPEIQVHHDRDVFEPGELFSWSKLMNHGFRHARGDWITYASDDIVFHPDAFTHALAMAHHQGRIGGVTFLHRNTVEDFGGRFREFGYDTIGTLAYINFGIVRRTVFAATHGFDERFRFYWADVDLCLQIWEAGFEIAPSPWALVDHVNIVDAVRKDNSGDRYYEDTQQFQAKWKGHALFHGGGVLSKNRFHIESSVADTMLSRLRALTPASSAPQASSLPQTSAASLAVPAPEKRAPKVTAIVSTFRSARFLRGCLEDLERQTIADQIEIIVVDSASPEGERAIVEEFQQRFSNIVYLRTEVRETVYGAWNRGIQAARGQYLTSANTDDRHRCDALEILARTLDENLQVTLAYADCLVTRIENETFETAHPVSHFNWLEFDPQALLLKGCFVGPQPMWRREVHDEHGHFDATMVSAGDYEFWLRIARNRRFLHVKEMLGLYLESPTSVEHTNRERASREVSLARERHREAILGKASKHSVTVGTAQERKPLTLPPCALLGHLGEARQFFNNKKLPAAWGAVRAALKHRPFHPEAYLLMAEIALAAHDAVSARACAQYARQIAPEFKPAKKFLKASLHGNLKPEWLVLPDVIRDQHATRRPHLSVCLIVKNEERFLGQCLASVEGLADQIVVVDTGSTDRTVEIAKHYKAEVHSFTWCDDFSAARNAALEHVTGDWVLALDADEELPPEQHEALRKLLRAAPVISWRLPLQDVGREAEGVSYVPRLFRNAPAIFYVGRVHEQVFTSLEVRREEWGMETRMGDAMLRHHGYTKEVTQERDKVGRNLRLLEKAVCETPGEANLLMNYGLELTRSGRQEEGLRQYRAAFEALSDEPPALVVPESREMLLGQFCTQLMATQGHAEIVRVMTSPLAKLGVGLTASLHFTLGLAQMELKEFALAAEQFRQCLAKRNRPALTPVNVEIRKAGPHHCLALCLAQSGDKAAAEREFQVARQDDPESVPAVADYARFLQEQGKAVEGLQLLHQFTSEHPQAAVAWQAGGAIALSQPEFLEVAVDWTAEALRHFPGDATIQSQRAEALLLSGQPEAALPLWQKLIASEQPVTLAALILGETAVGKNEYAPPPELAGAVTQEFVNCYRRLLMFGAEPMVRRVNAGVDGLARVLPRAAELLRSVIAEANAPAEGQPLP